MSRIGNLPVKLPSGVSITFNDQDITVTGPKGSLSQFAMPGIKLEVKDDVVLVSYGGEEKKLRSQHGLLRSLVFNMVEGVSNGFTKQLELNGVGYRVNLSGNQLKFNLGFSHDVTYTLPQGITASIDQNIITLTGINKQQIGQVAAEIRALKKPEPYKGKGIKYVGERIIRKSGKSGKEK